MTTDLREQALTAYEARRAREQKDADAAREQAIATLRDRAVEELSRALELETSPTDWKLGTVYPDEYAGTVTIETGGLRFAYHEPRYGTGGPRTALAVQERCDRCGGWYDAQDLSTGMSSYPAIERLGRYYAERDHGHLTHEPYVCPATRRCDDDACLRPDPHYGHAQTVEAAEAAPAFEEPAQTVVEEPLEEGELSPDEKLGNALRTWLQENAVNQAHAIGAALHDEIEQALGSTDG